MKFNACPVTKALGSVKRMCDAGHTVLFDGCGSYIYNTDTGDTTYMREDYDNYVLDMWVPPHTLSIPSTATRVFRGSGKI